MNEYRMIHINLPESQVAVIDVLKEMKLIPSRAQYVARLINADMRERHMRTESKEDTLSKKQLEQIAEVVAGIIGKTVPDSEVPRPSQPRIEPKTVIPATQSTSEEAATGLELRMFGKAKKDESD